MIKMKKQSKGGNRSSHFLLSNLLPSIGVHLECTNVVDWTISHFWNYHTSPNRPRAFICKECGMPFISKAQHRITYFCSESCAQKFIQRRKREKTTKLILRLVDQKAFTKWFKQYNNIVIGYIYNNYDSVYREDLIDKWTDKSMYWYYRCVNKEKPMNFLKTCLHHSWQKIKATRKEVFYSECNYKTQEKILGEYTERY